MNIENYIESQYRQLLSGGQINPEFGELYTAINHAKLKEILTGLHYNYVSLFRMMNERLPTSDFEAHFWAEPSRQLIKVIEITIGLLNALKNTEFSFSIDSYYFEVILKCRDFLSSSGGSSIPSNMPKIELYYTVPIFKQDSMIEVNNPTSTTNFELKIIGTGSYANVYKYCDTFYNKTFVLKRAKKDLTEKELLRFKLEYEEMNDFSSPYIVEVYRYNHLEKEYIMEYLDFTLDRYIYKNNTTISDSQRRAIGQQILKAFDYVHSKGRLHRDISPKNILLKKYEDLLVVKIADFGLVKKPDSSLTTANTEFKGYFNDPSLVIDGFDTYNILHETYALTRILYYVLTGKTNVDGISDPKLQSFVTRGLNVNRSLRFKNVNEMLIEFRQL